MGILGLPCVLHPNEFGHNMLSSKGPWKPISMPDHLIGKMEEKPSDPFIGEMDEKPSNCECVSDPTFSYNGVSPASCNVIGQGNI